ncbi:MAG: nucleotidyltransferase family protein [Bacilli bacterium]|nr:nucleotidyltransferase family protein [Bacilli bacterium]
MITGIILAGGYSSRTNTNKMLLELDGIPLIAHVIQTMQHMCQRIIVVTGHYHKEISEVVDHYSGVEVVQNKLYDLGMFSSVITGVKETKTDFFLVPGDYPIIKISTYKLLLENKGCIRVPTFEGRRGHPIFIEEALIKELLQEPMESNLKVFRDRYTVSYIETKDQGIIQDIDTMDDYFEILQKRERVEIL